MLIEIPNILLLIFLIRCYLLSSSGKDKVYIACVIWINSRFGSLFFTHALSIISIILGTWNLSVNSMLFPFITISIGMLMISHRLANKILIFVLKNKWRLLIIPLTSIFIWNISPFIFLLHLLLLVTATRFYYPFR